MRRQDWTARGYARVIASAEAKAAQTFDKFSDIITQEEKEPEKPVKLRRTA